MFAVSRYVLLTVLPSQAIWIASSSSCMARVSSRGKMAWNMQRTYLASFKLSNFSSAYISLIISLRVEKSTGNHVSRFQDVSKSAGYLFQAPGSGEDNRPSL